MHGQRTSASCARRFPMCVHQARPRRTCAFLHPTSGVHIRDAFAVTTIPPAPARAGGVQKTATKAQFNRNDKCPKLWSKPEPNPGRVHATVTTVTLRRCLLRVCDPGEFGVYLLIHHLLSALRWRWEFYTLRFTRRRVHLSWCTHHMKARMPINVIVSCRIRRDLP